MRLVVLCVHRSVCPSVCFFVCTMTNNSNDIIALTVQAAAPAIAFTSLPCSVEQDVWVPLFKRHRFGAHPLSAGTFGC